MSEEITQIPHSSPTREERKTFIECHVNYMSELVNKWLLKTGELLKDCDVPTRNGTMDRLVKELRQRIHYL
jgi:hypothetical protein